MVELRSNYLEDKIKIDFSKLESLQKKFFMFAAYI